MMTNLKQFGAGYKQDWLRLRNQEMGEAELPGSAEESARRLPQG
jgi:hypothetical protein